MSIFSDCLKTFFGGLDISNCCNQPYWLVFFGAIYILYSLLFYLHDSDNKIARLVIVSILMGIIFFIKLSLYIIRLSIRYSFDIEDQTDNSNELNEQSHPNNFSDDIWNLRHLFIGKRHSSDQIINDLINSGVDSQQLLRLAEYVYDEQNTDELRQSLIPNESNESNHSRSKMAIQCCNSIFVLPFSLHQIDKIYPFHPSFMSIIFSTIFGFTSSYLLLTLGDQFADREKWFIAMVLTSSTFSIVLPPTIDPYNTTLNDCWNSCTRPLFITILSFIWRIILDYVCSVPDSIQCHPAPMIIKQIYNLNINWPIILPYIFDVLHYGLLLSPLFILIGYIGHPVSVLVAILEGACRYCFGQNGVSGIGHLLIQILRGSLSVAASFGLLYIGYRDHNDYTSDQLVPTNKIDSILICGAIGVSTLINLVPFKFNWELLHNSISTFLFPLIAAILSFAVSILFTVVIHNNLDVIKWVCFGWLALFELVFPVLYSCHSVFFAHILVLPYIPFIPIFRYISSLVFCPLFLASSIQFINEESPLPILLISFIITHSVHKMNSETHIYAFAVLISVVVFPYEFCLTDPVVNLFLSLLIAAKIEVSIPVIKGMVQNRYSILVIELFEFDKLPLFFQIIIAAHLNFKAIFPDNLIKIPTLFWCLLTGGGFLSQWGLSYLLLPQPIKPNYFFDWPNNTSVYRSLRRNHDNDNSSISQQSLISNAVNQNINDHPIETPIYLSATRAMASSLGPLLKSGRFGHINAGNMYLFQSRDNDISFLLHVISIEPTCFKCQLRGLEYKHPTSCHQNEQTELNNILDEYCFTPASFFDLGEGFNMNAALHAIAGVADLRVLSTNFQMYDTVPYPIVDAFVGISNQQINYLFVHAFSFTIRKYILNRSEQNSSILENNEDYINFLNTTVAIHVINDFIIAIEALNNICQIDPANHSTMFSTTIEPLRPYFTSVMKCALNDFDQRHSAFIESLFNFFSRLCLLSFTENGLLKNAKASSIFNGDFSEAPEDISGWLNSFSPDLEQNILFPYLRYAYMFSFLASSGMLMLNDEESEITMETYNDVYEQLVDIDLSYLIDTINSPNWIKEFILGKKMILTIINSSIVRFSFQTTSWGVYQINHEYARALWGHEARDVLFYKNNEEERLAIQMNPMFLNNLIVQTCEMPIGYPAYTSEIFEAYYNPLLPHNLIVAR